MRAYDKKSSFRMKKISLTGSLFCDIIIYIVLFKLRLAQIPGRNNGLRVK
jgi:hypothetical protein